MRRIEEINLKPHERSAIKAATALLREHLPVKQIILFGSKARGDDREDSDIDLLLLTTRRLTWDEQKQVVPLLSPVQTQYEVFFGTIEISEDEWYNGIYQVLPLRTEVERDGVAA